jgi:protein-tyrosine-phosphatase
MAEGFARKYGSDVLEAASGGVAPAPVVQPMTIQVMSQKNIDISDHHPKSIHELELTAFDVIVNMSGGRMPPGLEAEILTWNVDDPITQPEPVYVRVRDQIEGLVMQLIMKLRRRARGVAGAPPRVKTSRVHVPKVQTPKVQTSEPTAEAGEDVQRFGFGRVRKLRD